MNEPRYREGESVVLRRVWKGDICRVTTATVVRDDAEWIALYWGPEYPLKVRKNILKVTAGTDSELRDAKWGVTHLLMLSEPGASHALYAMWSEKHASFLGWYINLQQPMIRTEVGFDTMDYLLDITVSADRSEWSWKDEEDFDDAVRAGLISEELASDVREEGLRAIERMQMRPSSFYDGWRNWLPPEEWQVPALPEAWDRLS